MCVCVCGGGGGGGEYSITFLKTVLSSSTVPVLCYQLGSLLQPPATHKEIDRVGRLKEVSQSASKCTLVIPWP